MTNVQTFLVLLASILFSTVILSVNNNLVYQSRMISYQMIRLQALKISELYFDKIESEVVSITYPFDDLDSNYDNVDSTFVINNVFYQTKITTNYCDITGDTLNVSPNYQRVDIRILVNYQSQRLEIGTQNSPLSKVFIKLGV